MQMNSGKVCPRQLDDGIGATADSCILFHSALYNIAISPISLLLFSNFLRPCTCICTFRVFLSCLTQYNALRAATSPYENRERLPRCVRSLSALLHRRPVSVMSQKQSISIFNSLAGGSCTLIQAIGYRPSQ